MNKKEIIEVLTKKFKHPSPEKLKRKKKTVLIQRLQQIQQNITENASVNIPELDVVEEF